MATPAVQAASCAGAATAVITTTVVVVPTADARPKFSVYADDTSFNGNANKLGKDAWMLLVDHSSKNKDWWEWSFRQLEAHKESEELDDTFKSLTSGFTSNTADASETSKELNKYCFHLFKTENTTTITSSPSTDKKHNSIWKYCSPLGRSPVLISEKEAAIYQTTNLGSTKKTVLISVESFHNSNFWETKNYWFQTKKSESNMDAFFSQFFGKNENQNLKEACKKAYSTAGVSNGSSATKDNPKTSEVIKYCGLKITATE